MARDRTPPLVRCLRSVGGVRDLLLHVRLSQAVRGSKIRGSGVLRYGGGFQNYPGDSQIIGYALSKYVGIKVCSEISRNNLARFLVGLILFAEFALLLFGLMPEQFKVAAIFLNGIPLGMVWGSVSRYLEGRRATEVMFAGLSCSYIVSSSSVKAFGTWLMDRGIDQFWMPVIAARASYRFSSWQFIC